MFESIARKFQDPALWPLLLLIPIGVILATLSIIFGAVRRGQLQRDPKTKLTLWPELCAVVAVSAPAFCALFARHSALGTLQEAMGPGAKDPSTLATQLAYAISTQLNTDALVALVILPTAAVSLVGAGLLTASRLHGASGQAKLLGGLGAALGLSSLLPLAMGVLKKTMGVTAAFSAVAAADPAQKAILLKAGMAEAAPALERAALITIALFLLGALLVGLALLKAKPEAARPGPALVFCAIALSLSGALVLEARSFQVEVTGPPIPTSNQGMLVPPGTQLPALKGPDPLTRAPTVFVDLEQLNLEGVSTPTIEVLIEKLKEMKKIDRLMHPNAPFDGRIILCAAPRVPGARLLKIFGAFSAVGYRNVYLAFEQKGQPQDRPLLGRRVPVSQSSAQLELIASTEGTVRLAPEEPYEDFAKRVIQAREKGQTAQLPIAAPKEPEPNPDP